MILAPNQHEAPLYRRSALQVSVLMTVTMGLYYFYWAYKVRRFAEVTLELPNQSFWKTVAMIVPIFNLFMLADLSRRVDGVAFRAELPPVHTFGWCFLAGVIGLFWRLPSPFWLICLLDFVPLGIVHYNVMRAQVAITGQDAMPQRLTWIEYAIAALGGALLLLVFYGTMLDAADNGQPVSLTWLFAGLIVAALITIGRVTRLTLPSGEPLLVQ